MLTIKLTAVVKKVGSPYQTAFILGRNILEGVVILQEVLHELRSTKSTRVILKLYFEKAYGKVSWDFLLVFLNAYKNNPQAHRITVVAFQPEVFGVSYFHEKWRCKSLLS